MSLSVRNQTSGTLERVAGFNDTDMVLSGTSHNPIANKAVYNALAQKIDKTVTDLVNYYDKSQIYTKTEVRELIGSINTLTIEVVSALPTQDISATTIYFVGPAAGTNTYDEYVYVGNSWVKIGDTDIDLSGYVTSESLTTTLQSYYTKAQTESLLNSYYTASEVDDLLDTKQDTLEFDNQPIAGSPNPVTSAGIKTALDNILISGNGGSIIKVHHTAGAAAQGNTVTASKGSYSVSSTFDVSGDAIIIGFGEIGDVTITATNGSETGTAIINIPCFSNYSAIVAYGLDYVSWLRAGNIDPAYYQSLNDVLADEEAVRKLMTVHASVNYLASVDAADDELITTIINNDICAKWINLRDYALDTLSANSYIKDEMDEADKYGYGEWVLKNIAVIPTKGTSSTIYSSTYAVTNGFSEIASQYGWLPSASDTVNNCYIQYSFDDPVTINQIGIRGCINNSSSGIKKFELYVSSNGTNWTATGNTVTFNAYSTEIVTTTVDLNGAYQYYRFVLKEIVTGTMTAANGAKFYLYSWGPKGNVPYMTSNTAPIGQAFGTSIYSSAWDYYMAFDNHNTGSGWSPSSSATYGNVYVGYQFPNPVIVRKVYIYTTALNYGIRLKTYKLQGSNDGSNWTDIGDVKDRGDSTADVATIDEFDNDTAYLYYRIMCLSGVAISTTGLVITRLQFYGRELQVSVPAMSNNTTPYGKAFASTVYNTNYPEWKAFTRVNDGYGWNCAQTEYSKLDQAYVGYDFRKPVVIKGAYYVVKKEGNVDSGSKEMRIIARNNTTDPWTIVSNVCSTNAGIGYIETTSNTPYRYWAIRGSFAINNTRYFQLYQLNFYGYDYTERDWDTDNPMKYIYDHGVELEQLITDISRTSGYAASKAFKHEYEIELHSYASSDTVSVATAQQIDLAPNKYLEFVRIAQIQAAGILIDIAPVNNNYYSSLISETSVTSPTKETVKSVNVSSITNPEYLILDCCNSRWSSVTEWWLE